MSVARTHPQPDTQFLSRTSPQPPFESPQPEDYNIKIGPAAANLYASTQFEVNDNINLSQDDPEFDFSLAPNVRVGFVWPITDKHELQFTLGAGYRYYLNQPSISSITIDPNSRLRHKMSIGAVQLTFSDRFAVVVDPTTRGELSGEGGNEVTNFRRFRNTAGVEAGWQLRRDLSVSLGYDFTIDRSLSGDFGFLDRNEHTFSAGVFNQFTGRSTLGIQGEYSINSYQQQIQNDGVRYTTGPAWGYTLSRFITLRARVGYTVATFDRTGTITDRSDFEGFSYGGDIRHELNSRMTHSIQLTEHVGLGLGSNFTETTAVQYMINGRLGPYFHFNSSFAYENLRVSGAGGEVADRYLIYLGTGFELNKNWTLGVGYTFSMKDSDRLGRDYTQNRITLDLTRDF